MKQRFYTFIRIFIFFSFFYSCESRVDRILHLAGENKNELEKVLSHYKHDELKYKAACFLIENMPGAFGADSSLINVCDSFYDEYTQFDKYYYLDTLKWGTKIDSIWDNFYYKNSNKLQRNWKADLNTLTSKQLIAEIDLAFEAWQGNVYTQHCSFEDFCEYILPYRRTNGLIVDDSRQLFFERHFGSFFTQQGQNFIEETDSLLYLYKELNHSQFYGTKIPLYSASTFERMRHGLCEHRCWYNSLLLSSLGMAAAIDFVPAWGNRNNSHTWNTLIIDGESYPFESFWDEDRWKYKRIYNNTTYDENWGKFRLAKVYRRTYKHYRDDILDDPSIKQEDVPSLFRNVWKKDVSHEYFDTVNIALPLVNVPENCRYAYLCVLNYNEWQPVQWGKIEKGVAYFNGMGKDIVYLPAYYRNGMLTYGESPFLLDKNGSIQILRPTGTFRDIIVNHYSGVFYYPGNKGYNKFITNTILLGSENEKFIDADTICVFPKEIGLNSQFVPSMAKKECRYVRMLLPNTYLTLSNLKFYKREADAEIPLMNVSFLSRITPNDLDEAPENILDDYSSTGFKKPISEGYVDLDLGEVCELSSIKFWYLLSGFNKGILYQLYYWNNGWKLIDSRVGENKNITFKSAPDNALLLIKVGDNTKRVGCRPFLYKGGEVYWY